MCGHGSIGAISVAIEFGRVNVVEPVTTVVLDTPAGLVTGYAKVGDGLVETVSIHNVPSFLYKSATISVPNLGSIPVDVAFGGEFFAIIDADEIGLRVDRRNVSRLSELAITIRDAANSEISVSHPEKPISAIDGVRIFTRSTSSPSHMKNITVFEEGDKGVDRSPCGTGTSAHL
jgi:proline racemase